MEVTYTVTLDDFTAFSLYSLRRSPSLVRRLRVGWLGPPVLFAGLAAFRWSGNDPERAILFDTLAAVWLVAHPLLTRALVTRSVQAFTRDHGSRGVLGPTILVLTEDSLTERTETVQSVIRWQDMQGVEIDGDRTYVYVTGLSGAIISRQGFERPEEYDAVQEFVFSKLGKPS